MTASEFIDSTLGKPWVNRGEGPSNYDCWGLVLASFRKIDGVELPSVCGYAENASTNEAAGNAISSGAFPVYPCQDGDIACYYDSNNEFVHVGRVLLGGVLHSRQNGHSGTGGVTWDKIALLERHFHKVEYRRYANLS